MSLGVEMQEVLLPHMVLAKDLTNLTWACFFTGATLTHLRQAILASNTAREQGITNLTVHDIMAATLWIAR